MALTEGTEEEKGKSNSNRSLEDLVLALQKQVAELQQKNNGQSLPAGFAGMSAEQFQKFMDAVTETKKKDLDYEEGIDEAQIPPEDFDEDGVRFCVPSTGYAMSCDRRKGKIVKLPWNKKVIFFEHEGTRKINQGKFHEVAPISSYRSHSKKEIEWIRQHSMYGVLIYENSNNVINANMVRIQKLSRVISVLKNYDYLDLMKRCKEYGVKQCDDVNELRFLIAQAMVDREMQQEGLRTSSILQAAAKESLVLDK